MRMNEKILQCRKRMGLSQEELAQQLNTSRQAVSKWELGAGQPDLQNVIALAKLFGVTTDWLLMEDEPEAPAEQTQEPEREPEQAQPQPAQPAYGAADAWIEHVPGLIGKLVRKYGWLTGVYIAVSGAGMTLIGAIAKAISDSMVSYSQRAFNSIGGFGVYDTEVAIFDASGAMVTDPAVYEAFGMAGMPMGANVTTSLPNPVGAVATVVIIMGVLTMAAGAVLAYKLHQRSEQA